MSVLIDNSITIYEALVYPMNIRSTGAVHVE